LISLSRGCRGIVGMHDFPLVATIAAAFASAWVLGLLTQRIGLSPIVGYLLGGVVIGPYTPGFVGDVHLAQQLAEIGVILLMFGVGLHFHLKDLLAVKNIAIPGALVQSAAATGLGGVLAYGLGWPVSSGLVLGAAVAVASTVVLMRVLMDHNMLQTSHGHVAVGWLVVEDLLTVLILVMLPIIAQNMEGAPAQEAGTNIWLSFAWILGKLAILAALFGFVGSRLIPWLMVKVTLLGSRELFTLTVLVMAIALAAGSAYVFGASMALGAFLAGMVVAQSPVSHQAAADALPMRDAFAVLFFVSVGMLFDPAFLFQQPLMVVLVLGIVLIGKPLAALLIVLVLGRPLRTGLTVAVGLAQIGEFSFIVGEQARSLGLLHDEGNHALVACAIISITLNPLLFRGIDPFEAWLKKFPMMARWIAGKEAHRGHQLNNSQENVETDSHLAVVVGYGPAGQTVDRLLRAAGWDTVIVDMNLDTVMTINKEGRTAIFGDASNQAILEQAGIRRASCLVVTLPHSTNRVPLISLARELNAKVRILTRARYLKERPELESAGADWICVEEEEAAVGLAEAVMRETGAAPHDVQSEATLVRSQLNAPSTDT